MKELFNIGITAHEKQYSILMGLCWCLNLKFYLIPILNRFGISDPHNGTPVFFVLLALFCVSAWKNRFKAKDILLYLSFVSLYYLSELFYPNTASFVDEVKDRVLIQSMPYLFIGLIFCYDRCRNALHLFSLVAIACNVLFFYLMSGMNKFDGSLENEQMNAAYWLLPSLLIVTFHAFEEKQWIDLLMTVIGTLLLLMMGTRGPIVIYVCFIAAYFVFFTNTSHPKITKTIVVLAALIFYWFSDMIALALMGISSLLGLSTRVFESILEENMFSLQASSGRDNIISGLMQYLLQHNPWSGFGLGSDIVINGEFYSHNVFVEMLFSFGFLFGGILLLVILHLIYKAFRSCTSREEILFLMALFCSGFMKVCFSSRFIWEPHFYMLIGVCIAIVRKYKNQHAS